MIKYVWRQKLNNCLTSADKINITLKKYFYSRQALRKQLKMNKIPIRTLVKIAAYSSMAVVGAGVVVQTKLRNNVKESGYYKSALQILRSHKGAVMLLGEPIKETGFDMYNSEKNYCDGYKAHFEVKVRGPIQKGIMHFWAQRQENSNWDVHRIELHLKNDPDKILLVKNTPEFS